MNLETVEQFMARALHDPHSGYYARNIRSIGPRGDFTTAPQLSEAPAKAIASWAATAMRKHKTWNIIEIGPGHGTLSAQVLKHLPFLTRLRTKLHLVESSPALLETQRKTLAKKANYHSTIHQALMACRGRAVVYSNELVDAFPARVFQKNTTNWQELAIHTNTSNPEEVLLPCGPLPPSSIFREHFPPEQRVEVHDSYRQWLTSWLPEWKAGEMLTIDYGTTSEKIYHRRPKGTLRSYFHHILREGITVFENPGHQDITTDVNFTDLCQWAEPWLKILQMGNFSQMITPHLSPEDQKLGLAADHFSYLIQSTRP